MAYIVYKENTGEITKVVYSSADDINHQLQAGEGYILGEVDDRYFYILAGDVVPRPKFALDIVGTVISNIPLNTSIRIEGIEYTATETEVELSFDSSGEYLVYLANFPYVDMEVTIEITS